jgi:hypothetical protein
MHQGVSLNLSGVLQKPQPKTKPLQKVSMFDDDDDDDDDDGGAGAGVFDD